METIADAAMENDLGVQLHWLETSSEWDISGLSGKITPEEYLVKTGMTKVRSLILAHCVWIDQANLNFYAKDNITVVHNPKSNLKLGSGTAAVAEMLSKGVSVAIGTDGAASNNRLDIWDELRFAALLQKGINSNPTLLSSVEALKMATITGARALGFSNTGLIREGYNADMILIDLDQPHYIGWDCENLPGYIVYAGSSKDIKATVVAGEMLYDCGEFTTIDKRAALAAGREARKKLTGK